MSRVAALTILLLMAFGATEASAVTGGAIDSSFASCGQATGLVPRDIAGRQFSYGAGSALAAQPDGRIVAAGPAARGMGATRFNPDGSPDQSFGGDGVAFIPASSTGRFDQSFVTSVALQPDGKVVVGGWMRVQEPGGTAESAIRPLIARFTAAGEPDTTFSGDGLVDTVPPGASSAAAHGLAVAPDGALIVAGQVDERFAAARVRDDGSFDPGFGAGGVVALTAPGRATGGADAVAVRPDGRILAAGRLTDERHRQAFTVARLTAGGTPDPSFAGDGSLTETFDESSAATALLPLADGGLYAVGRTVDRWDEDSTTTRAAIVRYREDGTRDPAFAGDGTVLDALGGGLYANANPSAAALDPGGRVTVATERGPLARYTPDGARDGSFGLDGVLRIFGATSGESLIALPDGALVLGGGNDRQGTRPSGFEWGPAIARLAGGGAALERAKGQPAACFLRVRNPTLTHLLRRGRVARYGKLLVGALLTQPARGTGTVRATATAGGSTFEVGSVGFSAPYAGGTGYEIRVRKDAYRRLSRVRKARIELTLTGPDPDLAPATASRTLRR